MFMPLSRVINNNLFLDSFDRIRADYLKFVERDYFFDYSHDYDLVCEDLSQLKPLKKTDHFWKVCPLLLKGMPIPFLSEEVKSSFTVNLLMSLPVKPVVAVFSLLEPHSEVDPHIDTDDEIVMNNSHVPFNERETSVVKYHFSLEVPDGGQCGLTVLDESRILKNGDLNPFDETSSHSAYNRSDKRRGVLIVSFLRHQLYPEEKA